MVEKVSVLNPSLASNVGLTNRSSAADLLNTANQSRNADPFKSLDLDQLNLSDDARQKVTWARSQFELSYQVIRSLNTANGAETTEEFFSFKGSYEFLQKTSGRDPIIPVSEITPKTTQTAETTSAEKDALAKLQEYFSPEKTAERILDVALSFYGVSETAQNSGESEATRKTFADFIGNAIEEGFSQARTVLGTLPEDIEAGVGKTHSLIFTGLENFVKNGISLEKLAPGGVMEKIVAYRLEAAQNMEQIKKSYAPNGYNSRGEPQEPPAEDSKVSKIG